MALINPGVIDDEIERWGSSVTVSILSKTYSEWGDESITTSNSTLKVVHNDIQGDEDFNREGRYRPGDKVFFVKSTDTINVGDIVIFNTADYQVKDVIKHHIQDTDYVIEARAGRV